MSRFHLPLAAMLLAVTAAMADAQPAAPAPSEFTWRATLEVPSGAALARVALPAPALLRLQSPDAADLRVFDAQGRPQAHALAAPVGQPAAPRQATPDFAALRLSSSRPAAAAGRGVQVRVQDGSGQRSVWVSTGPSAVAASSRLPSVLFDTRASRQAIAAVVVRASLPANAPVAASLWFSADLAQWTPVPVRGRLYRFDGAGAPANDTLELEQPLTLEGRYLRLDWSGSEQVEVSAIAGLVAPAAPVPPRVVAELPAPVADGAQALVWELPAPVRLAALSLQPTQANTLLPVRVLGRARPSEPWQPLGQALVYRFGSGPAGASPPIDLGPRRLRWLRVESTHGLPLQGVPLGAQALLEPVEVVFVPGGQAPYTLAAGRPETPVAALPLASLTAAAALKPDAVPRATLGAATLAAAPLRPPWARMLPEGVEPRSAVLWVVLIAGVAVLGGVAWSLLRQLGRPQQSS